jgi:hypothetical protein
MRGYERGEDDLGAEFAKFFSENVGAFIKAPITGAMIAAGLASLGGSLWPAIAFGFGCMCITAFRTWRRPLELGALVCLAVFALSLCYPAGMDAMKAIVQRAV